MSHSPEVQALIDALYQLEKNCAYAMGTPMGEVFKALHALEPEPPKPREIWITGGKVCASMAVASTYTVASERHLITHFREVLPEKPIVWMPEPDYFPWKDDTFKASYDLKINKNYYTVLRNYLMQLSHGVEVMNKRTHDQTWLEKHALFGCCSDGCAEEHSYPADDLALNIEGEPICEACWEWNMQEGNPPWSELRRFNPFEVK